jgi:heat shock protein HtpX
MPPTVKNLYERQQENRSKTVVLIGFFILFLAFLGAGLDFAFLGRQIGLPIATLGAVAIGSMSAYWSLHGGDQAILASTGAQPIDPSDPRQKVLDDVLEEMAIASGLPKPRGYVLPDADPNAFATGADPAHASIAVTEGLLSAMNREELQAVVSHEMSHVRDYDTRYMTVLAALAGAVLLIAAWGRRGVWWGGLGGSRRSRNSGRGGGPLVLALWLVAIVVAPIVARIVTLAVSRQREYLADATGAELTRNPLALASALEKISAAAAPTRSIKDAVAQLCIEDPRGRALNQSESALANLFATHPPIARRIARLREMAYQMQPRAGA